MANQFIKLWNQRLGHANVALSLNGIIPQNLDDYDIAVFDFDGVLIDNVEETVYRIKPSDGERKILDRISKDIGLISTGYDTQYLRHMIFQEALKRLNAECIPGPYASLAQNLNRVKKKFFILTARSAPAAIQRALSFLSHRQIKPTEIFFVGRVGKGRQLSLIKEEFSNQKILYFEDSKRHYRNANRMKGAEIDAQFVHWDEPDHLFAQRLYSLSVVEAFLKSAKKADDMVVWEGSDEWNIYETAEIN